MTLYKLLESSDELDMPSAWCQDSTQSVISVFSTNAHRLLLSQAPHNRPFVQRVSEWPLHVQTDCWMFDLRPTRADCLMFVWVCRMDYKYNGAWNFRFWPVVDGESVKKLTFLPLNCKESVTWSYTFEAEQQGHYQSLASAGRALLCEEQQEKRVKNEGEKWREEAMLHIKALCYLLSKEHRSAWLQAFSNRCYMFGMMTRT